MNNPVVKAAIAAWEVLSSKESIQWYKQAFELLFCFALAFLAVLTFALISAVEGIVWVIDRIDWVIQSYVLAPNHDDVYRLDQ